MVGQTRNPKVTVGYQVDQFTVAKKTNQRSKKWCAQITFKRKTYFLGSFPEKADAIAARKRGENLHREFLQQYYEAHPENAGQKALV